MSACLLSSCTANELEETIKKGEGRYCCDWIMKLDVSTTFLLKNLYLILDQLFRQNLQTALASAHIMDSCDCDDDDRFSHKQRAKRYKQSSSSPRLLRGAS